jgi:hypothetical protein
MHPDVQKTEPVPDTPAAPGAAAFAVVGALLTGAGAIAMTAVFTVNALGLLLAAVLVAAGWAIYRLGTAREHPVTRALGHRTLRGIGTSLAVLGAYLAGLAALAMAVSGGLLDDADSGSVFLVVFLVYGTPALALLVLAATGMRAWTAGAGAVSTMLVVLVMNAANASVAAVSITMLVAAVALALVVLRAPAESAWGNVAAAAGAMAAGYAFGAGTSPFGTLGAGQAGTQTVDPNPAGALDVTVGGVVLALALIVTAVLVLVAVVRRDVAGGILAGSVVTIVPAFAGPTSMILTARWVGVGVVALVVALVVVTALVAARLPAVRAGFTRLIAAARSAGAPAAAACGAVIAVALVVLVVQTLPLFAFEPWVQGVIGLALLLVAGALAYALPGAAGAAAAVAVLIGLHLFPVWPRLLWAFWEGARAGFALSGVLTFVTAVAAAWLFMARHRRVAVSAAAAYVVAGSGAYLISALAVGSQVDSASDAATVAVVAMVLPLFLIGVVAAVAAWSTRFAAYGQAVGAVVLAAGGFLPMKVLLSEVIHTGDGMTEIALLNGLRALTPTDADLSWAVRETNEPVIIAMVVMVVLALVLAASVARRPSAALAGGAALALLGGTQLAVFAAALEGASSVGWTIGVVGLLAGVAAAGSAVVAARAVTPDRSVPS